jgi:predicted SAM-dependent methyltransferase
LKLHLGCGKRYIESFVHIDLCDLPHIDYKHTVDSLPMFQDGSVELIYSSHVFEYFDRQQAARVLREWHRVLMPEGVLRLAVPDFQALIEVYHQTGELNNILGPLYGRMVVECGTDGQQIIYHRTVYDFPSLKSLLEENGFTNVRRYDWPQTIHKNYDDFSQAYFPHMDKEHGLLISLNVEAIKK